MSASKGKKECPKPGKYPCPDNFEDLCHLIDCFAKEWQEWGEHVLLDLNKHQTAICNLEQKVFYGKKIKDGTVCDKDGKPTGPTHAGPPPDPPFGGP